LDEFLSSEEDSWRGSSQNGEKIRPTSPTLVAIDSMAVEAGHEAGDSERADSATPVSALLAEGKEVGQECISDLSFASPMAIHIRIISEYC
jgi:hypothetical protein